MKFLENKTFDSKKEMDIFEFDIEFFLLNDSQTYYTFVYLFHFKNNF